MFVCRLQSWRSLTMGEKETRFLLLSSGASSCFASSCGLLVIAPKRAQVEPLRTSMERSGSGLPSLHQNSHPMSAGTYSASKRIASRTMRVASITSFPIPSPGIQAIRYLAILLFSQSFRCIHHEGHEGHEGHEKEELDPRMNTNHYEWDFEHSCSFVFIRGQQLLRDLRVLRGSLVLLQPPGDHGFRPAGNDQFLRDRAEGRERERLTIAADERLAIAHFDLRPHERRLFHVGEHLPQVVDQLRALEDDEAVVERVALVRLAEAGRDHAGDAEVLERGRSLFARRSRAEV